MFQLATKKAIPKYIFFITLFKYDFTESKRETIVASMTICCNDQL